MNRSILIMVGILWVPAVFIFIVTLKDWSLGEWLQNIDLP